LVNVKILVIGSGAREHAIVHSLARESLRGLRHELHAAPGNPGIGEHADRHWVDQDDPAAVTALAKRLKVDLVVIGPEAPLVAGVADALTEAKIAVFGPSKEAARLEGSKAFAKEIMASAGVPTAMARVCDTEAEVAAALDAFGAPHVVKDDGLAGGKGVVVTLSRVTAMAHARACLAKKGGRVVVEEFLDGPEVSLFCISDGRTVVPLVPAQDFKRAFDSDVGPNTGGMGAYSPLPWAPKNLAKDVVAQVAQPTIDAMRERGTPFVGVLYVGLALTTRGMRVVEFNARFGDPETQSVLARLDTPLSALLSAAAHGRLAAVGPLRWKSDASVTVVIAAHGYPSEVRTGDPITNLDQAGVVPGVHVLQAGTVNDDGTLRSAGGRVLSVVAVGEDLLDARQRAYRAVRLITLPGSHFRTDIAQAAARPDHAQHLADTADNYPAERF
jgi:phosphoribosylamine--glycine ligase